MMPSLLESNLRPAQRAEAANAARRECFVLHARLRRDKPSGRMALRRRRASGTMPAPEARIGHDPRHLA